MIWIYQKTTTRKHRTCLVLYRDMTQRFGPYKCSFRLANWFVFFHQVFVIPLRVAHISLLWPVSRRLFVKRTSLIGCFDVFCITVRHIPLYKEYINSVLAYRSNINKKKLCIFPTIEQALNDQCYLLYSVFNI